MKEAFKMLVFVPIFQLEEKVMLGVPEEIKSDEDLRRIEGMIKGGRKGMIGEIFSVDDYYNRKLGQCRGAPPIYKKPPPLQRSLW